MYSTTHTVWRRNTEFRIGTGIAISSYAPFPVQVLYGPTISKTLVDHGQYAIWQHRTHCARVKEICENKNDPAVDISKCLKYIDFPNLPFLNYHDLYVPQVKQPLQQYIMFFDEDVGSCITNQQNYKLEMLEIECKQTVK